MSAASPAFSRREHTHTPPAAKHDDPRAVPELSDYFAARLIYFASPSALSGLSCFTRAVDNA